MNEFDPAVLGCTVVGGEINEGTRIETRFDWRRTDGVEILDNEIKLDRATRDDAGVYYCTATSNEGREM